MKAEELVKANIYKPASNFLFELPPINKMTIMGTKDNSKKIKKVSRFCLPKIIHKKNNNNDNLNLYRGKFLQ